jgi:predicted glutamine amidotransferase
MCEIVVFDPEQTPIEAAHQIAARFEDEQGDGLGVLAVRQDGDKFDYQVYKSIEPHWTTLNNFFQRNWDDAWRFVIHGRAATAGSVKHQNAHPLHVDCNECSFDWIIHNGSVRDWRQNRASLISHGHHMNTGVDTEVIAHKVGAVPDDISDHSSATYNFRGRLNYLLFSEDGIFVHVENKYHLTDEFVMTCSRRNFDDPDEYGFERGTDNEWMTITPDDGDISIDIKERTRYTYSGNSSSGTTQTSHTGTSHSSYRSGTRGGQNWNSANGTTTSTATDGTDMDDTPEYYMEEYEDHCSDFENIVAIKVAPGVMKIINEYDDEEEYIFRDNDPELYFWYAPDPTPDNLDQLVELAEAEPVHRHDEQASVDEFTDEQVEAAARAASAQTIETIAQMNEDTREAIEGTLD